MTMSGIQGVQRLNYLVELIHGRMQRFESDFKGVILTFAHFTKLMSDEVGQDLLKG